MEFLHLRNLALGLILSVLLLLPAASGVEAADGWTSRGPFCAESFGLAGNRALGYLAVGGSLFRSRDGWATWSRVGADLPSSYLSAVATAPRNARLVYFAVWDGGGVFRSRDGGESWTRVFAGLPDPLVDDLVVPAGPSGTVFAIAPYTGIYRSRNQGETWTDVSPHPGPSNYFELLAHPVHPERLAVRTLRGIWRSHDGGDTWKPWNAGLPTGDDAAVGLSGLTLVPDDRDIAFVTWYQTLYRSQGGGRWKRGGPIPVNSFAYVNTLVAGPGKVPVLLVGQNGGETVKTPGVLRSRDGGKTWKPVPLLGETVHRLSYLPALDRFIALTGGGAFQSRDLGSTWQRLGDGVAAARVRSLTAAGAGDRILVAGLEACPGGIARSSDGGRTWKIQEARNPLWSYGSSNFVIEVLATAPSRPLRVYAVAMDQVLRSDDGGITWTHSGFGDGIGGGRAAGIAVHPTNPDLVFVAGGHGLSRSLDGGRTWSGGLHEHPYNDMSAVTFDPGLPQRMLAASWNGGLTRSTDTGASWEPIPGTDFLRVSALAIDPSDSNVVLAGSLFDEDRIFRSVDGGSTWAVSDIGIEGTIRWLTFSADGSEAVAAGDEGVFVSRDGGRTWQRIKGAPAARAILLQKNGTLHVGTDAGVVSSQDALSEP